MSQFPADIRVLDINTSEGWASFRWGETCWRATMHRMTGGMAPLPREPELVEALLQSRMRADPVLFRGLLTGPGVQQIECPKSPNWLVPVAVAAVVVGLFWSRR